MEKGRRLNLIFMILVIVLIALVSFVGIYKQDKGQMVNLVKDISLSRDFTGARVIKLAVDDTTVTVTRDENGNIVENSEEESTEDASNYTTTDEPVNAQELLTIENFQKSQDIVEARLNNMRVGDYELRLDRTNGSIFIYIPEDETTSYVYQNVYMQGKFQIIDDDTNEILMDNRDIKTASAQYYSETSGTTVYLTIEFNKEGTEKLKEISQKYIKTTEITTDENGEEKETEVQKKVTLKIDDTTIATTYFGETLTNGIIQLSLGSSTSSDTIQSYLEEANAISNLINNGTLPIVYTADENTYVLSEYSELVTTKNICIVTFIVTILASVYMIKFGKQGILAMFSNIGFTALLLLVIRYTNVIVSADGFIAVIFGILLNSAILYYLLKENTNTDFNKKMLRMFKCLHSYYNNISCISICK